MKFFQNDSLCPVGREFLVSRSLSIPAALKMGVASDGIDIAFAYCINGKVARWKSRNIVDKKKMSMSYLSDADKAIFKMPFWNQSYGPTIDYLIITEGEFDCIALTQLGASNVVSLPNGAQSVSSVFKSQYAFLQRFKEIYICFDMDEAGEKAVQEAKGLLPFEKYRRIVLPKKDANEWVLSGEACIEDLQSLMRNAERNQVDEIVDIRDLPKSFYHALDLGVGTGWKEIDTVLGGLRLGEMTVISGDTGSGKTTFNINLICNILASDPRGVWINSWEMSHQIIIRKIANYVCSDNLKHKAFSAQQIAKFEGWMEKNRVYINPMKSKATVESLRKQVELVSKVYGVRYIMFDHLDYIKSSDLSIPKHERIEEIVLQLHEMAQDYGVHLFLVCHPVQKRGGEALTMNDLRGSASIKQYADNVLIIQKQSQPNAPDNRTTISLYKNRFLGSLGAVTLRYLPERDGYISSSELFTP